MLFLPCINIHLTKNAEVINYNVIPLFPLFIKRCFLTCVGAFEGCCRVTGLRVCWGEPDPGRLVVVLRGCVCYPLTAAMRWACVMV